MPGSRRPGGQRMPGGRIMAHREDRVRPRTQASGAPRRTNANATRVRRDTPLAFLVHFYGACPIPRSADARLDDPG